MSTVPDTYKRGEPLPSARRLNTMVKQTQNAVKAGGNTEKRQLGRSITITAKEQRGLPQKANAIRKAQIVAVFEDYIECVLYNERTATASTNTVYVAKPLSVRPSYYDGASFSKLNGDVIAYTKDATNPEWKRQADDGSTSVDQIILPCYGIDDIITIFQSDTSVQVDDVYLIWEDLTARWWAVI